MSGAEYAIEPLGKHHDRATFSSGVETLDRYLRQQARQDMLKNVAQAFVLTLRTTTQIAGYYTLSAFSVQATDLPPDIARRLPRYPLIPATLLGRLAVDQHYRGQGFGGILLLDALRRARDASQVIASFAVIVDAMNDRARAFYEHYQFQPITGDGLRLFIPIQTIKDI